MMYRADEDKVVMYLGRNETSVIATCLSPLWAEHIAQLLQEDYDEH